MSTLVYAALAAGRENGTRAAAAGTPPPSMARYVQVLAALVPAEVLALHGIVLSLTTEVQGSVTRMTDVATLRWAFAGLTALSAGLYVLGRMSGQRWARLDWLRACIPPAAFVGWTMLQRTTAFDAVVPGMPAAPRTVAALFLAVILGAAAKALAGQPAPPPASQERVA